ncbi:MAG: hypothetical protein K6G91_06745 [Kiritimatiellae bacterium]|nr:hypothetical protein [Kiritimatiellia bacterium]
MKLHLVGIGGVGMAGLAVLLKARGHEVSGCDLGPTPRTRWLESLGIRVFAGHDPSHVADADMVIATPAVPSDSPELAAAAGRVKRRGEVLAQIVGERDTIAVCGSHGKTTTATWTAKLLMALGEDVAWCIGGETGDFPVARAGSGPLVVEADESDGTLALYKASTLVVNKVEYDHPDHFPTSADYYACFDTARRAAADVVESESLPEMPEISPLLASLAPHNAKNARAAAEVAVRRGHSPKDVAQVLPEVVSELPDRRFQTVWPTPRQNGGASVRVVTDYAHHPTEMACAVAMAREACKGRLFVLFQPHRYSRTKALLSSFPAAFEGADEVVLCPTYAAFEKPVEGGDVADLYKAVREALRIPVRLARSCDEAWVHARNSMSPGDMTLLLGAGDIIGLAPKVVADCAAGLRRPVQLRVFIGAGTNTWKSDLSLDVEYVRTSGPAGMPGAELVARRPRLVPWMAGIPGTVGGWIRMNAGAFGHSFSEALEAVEVDGRWIPASECGFGYRTSSITGEIRDFRLKDDPDVVDGTPSDFLARRPRFPAGTFGSFFKNPPNDFAGRLLETVGAKDMRVGGAYVWERHANVIVRGKDATPSDVLALASLMRSRVMRRFGILLEPEVRGIQ